MAIRASEAGKRSVRGGLVAILVLALGGCAVASPFVVESSGSLATVRAVALPEEVPEGGQRAQLHRSLASAFANRSVTVSPDARYLADYSVSVRDAEGGLTTSNSAAASEKDIDWKAQPRKSRLLDGCDAQRMRATLVLMDRQSGKMAYRGEGAATACSFSDSEIAQVARQLVDDALDR